MHYWLNFVKLGEKAVDHFKKASNRKFTETIFYCLNADLLRSRCTVKVKTQAVNLGDGDGM